MGIKEMNYKNTYAGTLSESRVGSIGNKNKIQIGEGTDELATWPESYANNGLKCEIKKRKIEYTFFSRRVGF